MYQDVNVEFFMEKTYNFIFIDKIGTVYDGTDSSMVH